MSNRKYISSEVDRLCAKGLPVKPKGADAPSAQTDLKNCICDRLNEGGRDQAEAESWCKDYLEMRGQVDESAAIDSANIKEAERILIQARDSIMKPRELEQCTRNRMNMLGEGEFTAGKNCQRDWELWERIHGVTAATDAELRLSILDAPEEFRKLERLRLALDRRTEELMETSNMLASKEGCAPRKYTEREADRKARTELGLPQINHLEKLEPATMPEVFGKSREQRIKESYAADKRPGERMISPFSGVPNLYGKSRDQIIKEVFEQDAEDKNR
jgi:hypothetical protein